MVKHTLGPPSTHLHNAAHLVLGVLVRAQLLEALLGRRPRRLGQVLRADLCRQHHAFPNRSPKGKTRSSNKEGKKNEKNRDSTRKRVKKRKTDGRRDLDARVVGGDIQQVAADVVLE